MIPTKMRLMPSIRVGFLSIFKKYPLALKRAILRMSAASPTRFLRAVIMPALRDFLLE